MPTRSSPSSQPAAATRARQGRARERRFIPRILGPAIRRPFAKQAVGERRRGLVQLIEQTGTLILQRKKSRSMSKPEALGRRLIEPKEEPMRFLSFIRSSESFRNTPPPAA